MSKPFDVILIKIGALNPTLTIIAKALRIGDHLLELSFRPYGGLRMRKLRGIQRCRADIVLVRVETRCPKHRVEHGGRRIVAPLGASRSLTLCRAACGASRLGWIGAIGYTLRGCALRLRIIKDLRTTYSNRKNDEQPEGPRLLHNEIQNPKVLESVPSQSCNSINRLAQAEWLIWKDGCG